MAIDLLDAFRDDDPELWSAPRLLAADIQEAVTALSPQQARFFVDAYYSLQRDRIQAQNQSRALTDRAEPTRLTIWFEARYRQLEGQLQRQW
jgi:hypothetical protein